jgi:hypothetical protein
LRKYIFLTSDGANYQPDNDSPMPDFLDLQSLFMERGTEMQEALNDLIELQINPDEDRLDFTLPIDLRNDSRRLFMLREYKEKVRTAS